MHVLSVTAQKAEAERGCLDVKYTADTAIADSRRAYDLAKASFDQEVNTKVWWIWNSGEIQLSFSWFTVNPR